jgi:hypothetical protein
MMKKTAIALGLAMVTGAGFAAQGNTSTGVGVNAGVNAAGNQARVDANAAADTQFNALDRNGDGVLSRAEASASETVADLYESLDTSETIEADAKQGTPNGITREQFEAGMQARSSGSGSVGPAVSGGETYTIMRDGTRKLKTEAGNTADQVRSRTGGAVNGVTGAVGGSAQSNTRANANANAGTRANVNANAQNEAAIQRERAQDQAQQMQDRARDAVGQARSEAEMQRDRARNQAAEMQQRARGQATETYGATQNRVEGAANAGASGSVNGGSDYGAGAEGNAGARMNTDR